MTITGMAKSSSPIRHQKFRAAGLSWRVVFERYTLPLPSEEKPAYNLLCKSDRDASIASRRRCDYAIRVQVRGEWHACMLGEYVPGRGCANPDVLRDDIGSLDIASVLKRASRCFATATGTTAYVGGDCTRNRCEHCRAVRLLVKMNDQRAEANKRRGRRAMSEEVDDS